MFTDIIANKKQTGNTIPGGVFKQQTGNYIQIMIK